MDEADYANEYAEYYRQQALRDHFLRIGQTQREAQQRYPGDPAQSTAERGSSGPPLCLDCGEEIGAARMKANPAAIRCLDCQTQTEKTNRR
jgi:DnaK suppressor protein